MLVDLQEAVKAVLDHEVIAYPTEAVFGFGCMVDSTKGLETILQLKQRDPHKGFIIIGATLEMLLPYCDINQNEQAYLNSHWPAPKTFLVKPTAKVHPIILGQHEKIAVRVLDHKLALSLATSTGPIVSTSANVSGQPAFTTATECERFFPNVKVLNGKVGAYKKPSTIIDLATKAVIRP